MPTTRARTQAAASQTTKTLATRAPKRHRVAAPAPRRGRRKTEILDQNVQHNSAAAPGGSHKKRCKRDVEGIGSQNKTEKSKSKKAKLSVPVLSAEEAGIIGRQEQLDAVREFLRSHLELRKGGSLYVCGTTGTGKTACVHYVLASEMAQGAGRKGSIKVGKLNGNTLERPGHIYGAILKALGFDSSINAATSTARAALEKVLRPSQDGRGRSANPLFVVLLDEIDQLITASKSQTARQEVLYQLFRWANLPRSRLILIGIANAVNLHDRFLPELLREGYSSEMLVFPAYNRDQLKAILEAHTSRLASETTLGKVRFDPVGIELCARKVAAKSGDLRKGLDICKCALLQAAQAAPPTSLQAESTSEDTTGRREIVVGAATMLRVMRSALEASHIKTITELPLQVQYALCAIIRQQRAIAREGKRALIVNDVFRTYTSMTREWGLPAQPFASFCDSLLGRLFEDGLVALAGNPKKELRQRSLKVDVLEADAVSALEENVATKNLLSGKSHRHNGGVNFYAAGS